MAQLRQDYDLFAAEDTEILVVGPEPAQAFQYFWKDNNLPFVGMPDPRHHVLKLYGQEVNLFKLGRMPAQVLIDKQGCARHVHYGHSMKDIPENKVFLEHIRSANEEAQSQPV
jgi:peroxiredoxin Q/BCP